MAGLVLDRCCHTEQCFFVMADKTTKNGFGSLMANP